MSDSTTLTDAERDRLKAALDPLVCETLAMEWQAQIEEKRGEAVLLAQTGREKQ